MKNTHKLTAILLSALILFSINNYAQENKTPKESVLKKAYEICPGSLNSNIQGIVEASIYNIILLKKYYPSADYSWIIEKLNDVAVENIDPAIRFKAHLASTYLSFSDIIEVEPKSVFEHEYIYKQITDQLEDRLLVSN